MKYFDIGLFKAFKLSESSYEERPLYVIVSA